MEKRTLEKRSPRMGVFVRNCSKIQMPGSVPHQLEALQVAYLPVEKIV